MRRALVALRADDVEPARRVQSSRLAALAGFDLDDVLAFSTMSRKRSTSALICSIFLAFSPHR